GEGDLGFPTIDEGAGRVSADSRNSTFSAADLPVIFWTPESGAWVVRGAINAAWDSLGGSSGTLGVPTADETWAGDVVSQTFTGGQISYDTVTHKFTTQPAELADKLGDLKIPGDATSAINAAYRAAGGASGPLGARSGDQAAIGSDGARQDFAGGKIFYSPAVGAHAVSGAILNKYEAAGGPTGDLGFPSAGEADGGVPGTRVQPFAAQDNPVIFSSSDHGVAIVRGSMKAAWDKLGGAAGSLGVPLSDASTDGDTVTQKFTGGQISWDSKAKTFTTDPANLADSLKGLEVPAAPAPAPPAAPSAGQTHKLAWHSWWLWWIIPLAVLLVGSLLAWLTSRRRRLAGAQPESSPAAPAALDVAGEGVHWAGPGPDADEIRWPVSSPTTAETASFAEPSGHDEPAREFGGFETDSGPSEYELFTHHGAHASDEDPDTVDTAPTRVPSEFRKGYGAFDDYALTSTGRHAAIEIDEPWDEAPESGAEVMEPDIHHEGQYAVDPDVHQQVDYGFDEDFAEVVDLPPSDSGPGTAGDAATAGGFIAGEAAEHVHRYGEPEEWSRQPESPAADSEAEHVGAAKVPAPPALHLPLDNPYQAPQGYPIKGRMSTGTYHTPDSAGYDAVVAEIWFADAAHAESNGFVRAE
ncbi:MAG TPA: hypothetical protein VFW21_10135, partial [Mycobacterium sp.]|nr:hypothetical protein [Mycobacterium sp.]